MCLRFPRFVLKFLRREVEIGLFLFNITARNGKLQHSKSASVESVSTCQRVLFTVSDMLSLKSRLFGRYLPVAGQSCRRVLSEFHTVAGKFNTKYKLGC